MTEETIGVAGCGAMGLPMADCLTNAGFDVRGFDVRPFSDFQGTTVRMYETVDAFADGLDVVVSVVRDRAQTMDLLFDKQALLTRPDPPRTVILSSTLAPQVVREVADRAARTITTLDAPMSGAPYRAEEGTLTFMVGGHDQDVATAMPLFHAMGERVHHLGPLGTGMTCKVVNNFVGVTGVIAVRKALAAAMHLGLSPAKLLEVMTVSSGATWYGDNIRDIAWAREGYTPENTIGILEKDVTAYLTALGQAAAPEDFEDALLAEIRRLEPLEMPL